MKNNGVRLSSTSAMEKSMKDLGIAEYVSVNPLSNKCFEISSTHKKRENIRTNNTEEEEEEEDRGADEGGNDDEDDVLRSRFAFVYILDFTYINK